MSAYVLANAYDQDQVSFQLAPPFPTTENIQLNWNGLAESITITTNPANLNIIVDGTNYSGPQTFSWIPGNEHTIATTSPQQGPGGTQYNFGNWSNGGTMSQTIVTPLANTTYTASFVPYYQPQTISFSVPAPPSVAYGSTFTVGAAASSGLPVVYTSSGACSNAGATYTMTSGTGICSVIANQPGNAIYSAAQQVVEAVNAAPASQMITFTTNAPSSAVYNSSFTVAATATSGLAVTYSSSGGCSSNGATYTMISGTIACSVIANQAGNGNYSAATPVNQSVNATLASQTITAGPPAEARDKDTFTVTASGGGSGNPLVFTSSGDCSNSGAIYTMGTKAGTCTGTITQAGNSNYAPATYTWSTTVITVLVALAVTFTGAPPNAVGGSTFTVTATYPSTQGVPAEVPTITASGTCEAGAVSGSGNTYQATITMTEGSGTCTTTAKWAANFYYAAATQTQKTTGELITPTVSFTGAPASAPNGTMFTVTATSNEAGSYASVPTITASGACTAGSGSSTGDGSYEAIITITKTTGTCTTTAKWAASIEYVAEALTQKTTAEK